MENCPYLFYFFHNNKKYPTKTPTDLLFNCPGVVYKSIFMSKRCKKYIMNNSACAIETTYLCYYSMRLHQGSKILYMHAFLFFRSSIILKRRHLRIASNFFSHICCLKIQKQKKKREGEKEGKTYHSLHANYLLFKYIYI